MKRNVCLQFGWAFMWMMMASMARTAAAQDLSFFPTVTISASDGFAAEGGSDNGTFTVRRMGATDFPLAVFYQLSGTASNGVDYESLGVSVQIPAGASAASFVVKPIDDSLVEGNESVTVRLTGSPLDCATCGYDIGTPDSAVVMIVDNDGPVPHAEVNIYASDDTGSEIPVVPPWLGLVQRSDPATFTITRTGPTNSSLRVFYEVGGTASNGVDYVSDSSTTASGRLPGTVTIPAGASSVDVTVWVRDDLFVEGTETIELTLQPPICIQIFPPPPGCYEVGRSNRAVASILDNDLKPAPIVTIMATDPVAAESGPGVGTFTVSRTGDTSASLPVYFQIGGTAVAGVDYLPFSNLDPFLNIFAGFPAVVIPAGASSAELTVVPIDDHLVEGNETVQLKLQEQPWAGFLVGQPDHAVVTIFDDDLQGTNRPPVVSIVARDPLASEGTNFWRWDGGTNNWIGAALNPWQVNLGGSNTATFVVRREGAIDAALTVGYQIGGTASNGVDYLPLTGTVTILAGRHTARVVVVPIDDALVEGIETIVLTLKSGPGYAVGFPANAAAVLIDNDRPRPQCVLLPDRRFHVCRPATNGFCFRVDASPDLLHWTPLCTNVVTDGALHFVDPDVAAVNARFYRASPEPALPPDD